MAVTRAMARWHRTPGERELHSEQVLTQFESGAFLLDRLGAAGVIDQDLAVVLLRFRRRLIEQYSDGPAAVMLIAAPSPPTRTSSGSKAGSGISRC